MKLFFTSSLALLTGIYTGKRLERSLIVERLGRKTMATLALTIATWDVVAVGGMTFGLLTTATGANTCEELAKHIRQNMEALLMPLRGENK